LASRQDQYADGKANSPGAAGQKSEQYKRVVIGICCRADATAAMICGRVDSEHMIGRDEVSEAKPFRCLRIIT